MQSQRNRLLPLAALLALILGLLPFAPAPQVAGAGTVLYVAPTAQGNGDCSSWANACTLSQALSQAQSGDEIWVKEGTYKPNTSGLADPRTATFRLVEGVAMYGGFAGVEMSRDQRNWQVHPTILSGDIGTAGNNSDNVYHVLVGANHATLDGFTVTGGNANGGLRSGDGGGMYNTNSSPTLRNVIFNQNLANRGGGMFNTNGSSPSLTNVTFSNNSADQGGGMYNLTIYSNPSLMNVTFNNNLADQGGGMFNDNANPTLTNVTFSNNSAIYGGGMYNFSHSNPTLTNVTFSQNSASQSGGGVYNYFYSSPTLTNVTFSRNSASQSGGGVYNINNAYPTFVNVLIAGSGTQGGDCVNGSNASLNANSKNNFIEDSAHACGLTNGTNDNIVGQSANVGTLGSYGGSTQTVPLNQGSPAIDAGDAASCPSTDQRGVARPQGNGCDIGAYERDETSPKVLDAKGTVSAGDVPLTEGAVLAQGFSQLTIRFNEAMNDPSGSTNTDDVTNPLNYRLLRDNGDGIQTNTCAGGVKGGDIPMVLGPVTYNDHGGNGPFEATMLVNGGTPLPKGHYRLLVCGSTSLADIALNHLAGDGVDPGTDFVRNFTVGAAQAEQLPATGFAPGRVTELPVQPAEKAYTGLALHLEIPRLGVEAAIVGVPRSAEGWDVSWLGNEIGWLEGTAFPTWEGNAVLTGHVTDANGQPGPFAQLHMLSYDDAIVIHLAGQRYEFRVREVQLARPSDTRYVLKHLEGYPYLTLVTCRGFDEAQGTYRWRWVVRAVLVSVTADEE